MRAQLLYDRRDQFAEVSGSDLHELFRFLCDGDPSPSGAVDIPDDRLRAAQVAFADSDIAAFVAIFCVV